MHVEIDRHWDRNSTVHRLNGRLRILMVLVWMAALVWVNHPLLVLAGWMGAVLLVKLAKIPWHDMAVRSLAVALMLSPLVVVLPVFAEQGNAGRECVAALTMMMRGMGLVLLSFPLFNTARFHDTMASFRSLGVPAVLITLLLLVYRTLFIFLEDLRRMQMAARARGWQGGGNRIRTMKLCASQAGSLLVRSVARSERLWQAMKNRGYDGAIPVAAQPAAEGRDFFKALVFVLVPLGLIIVEGMDRWMQ